MFPSHIGSRSTEIYKNEEVWACRFHPTLVLAQPEHDVKLLVVFLCFHPTLVLAQLDAIHHALDTLGMFPSHIGSRSTGIAVHSALFAVSVSIPHWFSLNASEIARTEWAVVSFHPTLVLAQLQDFGEKSKRLGSFHPTLVLAQPFRKEFSFFASDAFPSHIGSRSTKENSHPQIQGESFPSHIGSRSTSSAKKHS